MFAARETESIFRSLTNIFADSALPEGVVNKCAGSFPFSNPTTRGMADRRVESALQEASNGGLCCWRRIDWERRASQRGLSYSRFAHLFRQDFGVSLRHFVKRSCLSEAKRLLEQSSASVKEIMLSVGFSDASHFSRDFKALTGLVPTEYRSRYNRGVLVQK
jgi:AraC-like DNA-binding protein